MGFTEVYDYQAGKKSWGSYGLPREGRVTEEPSAGEVARRDVPTCALDDDLREVRERVRDSGWDTCMVVEESGVLLGRLGRRPLRSDGDASVEEAMSEGPSTVRPSIGVSALLERMRERGLASYPVTTPDGRFVGLALRDDIENPKRV
jgi:CBS domain-containing protein